MSNVKAVGTQERIRYIHRVTGINSSVIKQVLDASYLLDMNSIAEGKRVRVGTYYTIYPFFKREHDVHNPVTNDTVTIKDHYLLKISPHKKMQEALDIATSNLNK